MVRIRRVAECKIHTSRTSRTHVLSLDFWEVISQDLSSIQLVLWFRINRYGHEGHVIFFCVLFRPDVSYFLYVLFKGRGV